MKTRLFWVLLPSYLVILGVCIAAITWANNRTIHSSEHARQRDQMAAVARVIATRLEEAPGLSSLPIQDICRAADKAAGLRVTVVIPDGTVVGDSRADPARMDNHSDRPEVAAALRGELGEGRHFSTTVRRDMFYVAVPVQQGQAVLGAVRVALEMERISAMEHALHGKLTASFLLIALVSIVASFVVARGISRPLARVEEGLRALAAGDLQRRLPRQSIREFDALGTTINRMADQLRERIDVVTRQKGEQEALVTCMAEGVLAVDREKHVLTLNRAAEAVFGVREADVKGRSVVEVIRNADLLRLVETTLANAGQVDGEVFVPDGERFLQVTGRLLRGPENGPRGAVLVMNDVTRLRRLERMRRDFVANVSHELKTPITSIRGFADTLLDGEHDPETAKRFLEKIAKQAERLHTLIEDILALSRVEHASERGEIELTPGTLAPVLDGAVRACQSAAAERGNTVEIQCAGDLTARINAPLLETAVINLVDNAIKYGGEFQTIRVKAERGVEGCVIQVADEGPGILKAHWERLFERFYRVDQGRSRSQGGTGLGLAIVKHVALAHGGQVRVHSEMGKGSVFSILLP